MIDFKVCDEFFFMTDGHLWLQSRICDWKSGNDPREKFQFKTVEYKPDIQIIVVSWPVNFPKNVSVWRGDKPTGQDVQVLELVLLEQKFMKNLARDAVALLQGETDEVVEIVAADDVVPDHVIQAVHQL